MHNLSIYENRFLFSNFKLGVPFKLCINLRYLTTHTRMHIIHLYDERRTQTHRITVIYPHKTHTHLALSCFGVSVVQWLVRLTAMRAHTGSTLESRIMSFWI